MHEEAILVIDPEKDHKKLSVEYEISGHSTATFRVPAYKIEGRGRGSPKSLTRTDPKHNSPAGDGVRVLDLFNSFVLPAGDIAVGSRDALIFLEVLDVDTKSDTSC